MSTATQEELADVRRQLDNLIARYGRGVRPGWVSEDEAKLIHRIRTLEGN